MAAFDPGSHDPKLLLRAAARLYAEAERAQARAPRANLDTAARLERERAAAEIYLQDAARTFARTFADAVRPRS